MKHSVLAVAFSLWLGVSTVTGRTILVDDEGPADFNNIQAAIDNSNNGDIIQVTPGTSERSIAVVPTSCKKPRREYFLNTFIAIPSKSTKPGLPSLIYTFCGDFSSSIGKVKLAIGVKHC